MDGNISGSIELEVITELIKAEFSMFLGFSAYILAGALIVLTNMFTCLVVWFNKDLREKKEYVMVFGLALADFCNGFGYLIAGVLRISLLVTDKGSLSHFNTCLLISLKCSSITESKTWKQQFKLGRAKGCRTVAKFLPTLFPMAKWCFRFAATVTLRRFLSLWPSHKMHTSWQFAALEATSRWDCMLKPWNLLWIWTTPFEHYMLLLITLDRLLAVADPMRYVGISILPLRWVHFHIGTCESWDGGGALQNNGFPPVY